MLRAATIPSSPTIDSPTFTGIASFATGTASAPSIAFSANAGSGIYYSAGNAAPTLVCNGAPFISADGNLGSRAQFSEIGLAASATSPSSDTILGRQAAGRFVIMGATATPAGGSAGLGLAFGSTSGFGIYIGSGAPTLSAAQGSLYLRSDGSSTSTRAYINNSAGSGTTWTAITTAA